MKPSYLLAPNLRTVIVRTAYGKLSSSQRAAAYAGDDGYARPGKPSTS